MIASHVREGMLEQMGCTIIYRSNKQDAKCCWMVEASRRRGYSEVGTQ